MNIKWVGHSCFLITSKSGATLLTDPYDPAAYKGELLYRQVDLDPDVVTVSHSHADHAGVGYLGSSHRLLDTVEAYDTDSFSIRGVNTFHDPDGGLQRGGNIVFVIMVDGIKVCHLGDLGHELNQSQVGEIGDVDLLLIPVGGYFTIDAPTATRVWQQLGPPPLTIPMHFRNQKCRFPIAGVEDFLAGKERVERPFASELRLVKENLPRSPKIVVLEPAN